MRETCTKPANNVKKVKSAYEPIVARQARAYPSFNCMKKVERDTVRVSVLPKNTTQCPQPGLEAGPLVPESSALAMRPPHLPPGNNVFTVFFFPRLIVVAYK